MDTLIAGPVSSATGLDNVFDNPQAGYRSEWRRGCKMEAVGIRLERMCYSVVSIAPASFRETEAQLGGSLYLESCI